MFCISLTNWFRKARNRLLGKGIGAVFLSLILIFSLLPVAVGTPAYPTSTVPQDETTTAEVSVDLEAQFRAVEGGTQWEPSGKTLNSANAHYEDGN